ncbi:precorrin-2 C(20)-methyltransferase [Anaerosporobacter sp.]|uniref:precorrin-2 C(20)-methyltransferase n=1 Tax=Anaerosporobacter sp. TaxID=1872529 RepID=UPI00286F1693|nr:precorrin-2 C(20)-methyltransferase [Anaerosporobacter sp.]
MKGILYGIGTGPGDPELLTLKAVRLLKGSDIIAIAVTDNSLEEPFIEYREEAVSNEKYDNYRNGCVAYNIAVQGVPEIASKAILYVPTVMTKDKKRLEEGYDKAAEAIQDLLNEGKQIAFITLGDPTVYSTYLYVHARIVKAGYEAQIISGIPSFCAASARMNQGLVERSEQLHIIPGSYGVEEALTMSGTKVFMKVASKMPMVKEYIRTHHNDVVMVENCGMEDENIYTSCEDIPDDASYYSLLIVKEEK